MKKIIQVAACATMVSVCLLGCGKQKLDKPVITPDIKEPAAAVSTAETTENITTKESAPPHTQHITQDIVENLSIDAEAVIPGKTQYCTYTLKSIDGTPDRLFGIFSPKGYGSYTTETRDYPGASELIYQESNGKFLLVDDDRIMYRTYNIDLGNHPMQEVATLMYYYTQEHPLSQPHDLPFMTVEEMENFGKAILSQLGVAWEPKLSKCVTLSGQDVLDFQKEMFTTDYYTQNGSSPITLTQADDTCYLEFTFTYDGIPLFGPDEPNISFMDGVFPPRPVKATIMLNADGIQDFDLNGICAVVSASEPQTILTLEAAIAALKSKYDLEILFGTQETTNIWMEYIPVKQGDTTVLTPYWCFRSIDASTGDDFAMADRINAITGKDLAYGG